MKTYKNPIMPGFYPDPSVCRVEDDYYLVNSTFAYFPGVPIFHSKNLVDWKQIGHVLTRKSQLDLEGVGHSHGIFAPTLRYHNGKFYMITTNIGKWGNFFVTAENPEGPWSDPIIVDADGIDPTIFFDGDKAYYLGTKGKPEAESKYYGDNIIWLQELDLESGKLIGEQHVLWEGAMKNAEWPEGPHLYKKDGYYYVMIAEGGTGLNHAITIARSKNLFGPYEGNPRNPILTHRHLGKKSSIINTGHGDLVETQNGEWWMVLLASRPCEGYCGMGRETFLVPVSWEDGWPVVNEGKGIVEEEMLAPNLPDAEQSLIPVCEHFSTEALDMKWIFLRNPSEDMYSLERKKGYLSLKVKPEKLGENKSLSFVARRQQHTNYVVRTMLQFQPNAEEEAGIVIMQNDDFNIRYVKKLEDGVSKLVVIIRENGKEKVAACCNYEEKQVYMAIRCNRQKLQFLYGNDERCEEKLIDEVDASILSTEKAGGFVGNCIGMYATGNGKESNQYAEYGWFEYFGA